MSDPPNWKKPNASPLASRAPTSGAEMKPIAVPAPEPEAARAIVRDAIARGGLLIEAPGLCVGHVVKQANGNPQAILDTLAVAATRSRYRPRS